MGITTTTTKIKSQLTQEPIIQSNQDIQNHQLENM